MAIEPFDISATDSPRDAQPASGARPVRSPKSEIKAMTGLRGIAALLVAAYHFYPPHSIAAVPLDRFVSKGYLWVDLFFVLSGFLMAMNYAYLFQGSWSVRRWLDFLLRRLARVYPLYLVVVLATVAYTLAVYGSLRDANPAPALRLHNPVLDIAANVLMIQSWGLAHSIDGVAWSLSTEWAAYLLFPFLAWLALFGTSRMALAASVSVAAVVIGTVGLTAHDGAYHSGPLDAYDGRTIEPILRCLGGFIMGLLTYRLAQSERTLAWASRDLTTGTVLLLLVTGFVLGAHDLMIYPLFALLVLGLYGNRGRVGQFFGCRPVHWLGLVSYSLYLLHSYFLVPRNWLIQEFQHSLSSSWAADAANLLACASLLCLSGIAYRTVEEPGRRCFRRLNAAVACRAGAAERKGNRLAA